MSKAQLQHVFAFIMMILIAGFIILIGYKFIAKIMQSSENIDALQFRNDLEKFVDDYNTFGDYHEERILVPKGTKEVCLVAADQFGNTGFALDDYLIIQEAVRDPETQPSNVFIITDKGSTVPINNLFMKKLAVEDPVNQDSGYLCLEPKSGYLYLGFEGKGKTTLVMPQ